MADPKVGQIYRVVKRPATKGDFYWYDGKWACSNYTHSGASPILEPIDPARVTIAPKPERFYRNDDARVRDRENPDWHVVLRFLDQADQLICTLNTLERAAKEKSNG